MKKLIKLDFNNTTKERKTEDSLSELYSYDKNNGLFEFEILNDTLTTEQVTALFKFTESNKIWKTTGTVEGNKVNVTFDTSLITQNETVVCYLYFDEEQRTSDTFRFKFKVKVSEIDKINRYEVKERFINNTVIVDRLDVVTKDELKEALKNVGGIATEGLLTEVKAEETYAKKSETVDNTNFELVKNRVLALELKTDKDTVYDDSELKGRISVLENKEDNNTIYDDTSVRERLTALESKPNIDVSTLATKEELEAVRGSQPSIDNLVTKEELESKNYLTEHQNLDGYAKKFEIPQEYNDTEVKERLTNLENKASLDLSNLATKQELNEVRNSQPTVDTSNLVTRDELTAKNYLTEHQSLENLVTKQELEDKHYLTEHQPLTDYAKKSELYNDTDLKARVTALESKAIEGGAYDDSDLRNRVVALEDREDKDTKYDDTDLKNRVINLENKPPIDTSEFVTNQTLESKGYIKDVSNLVTKDELENKHFLTEHQDLSSLVTKQELEEKQYLTTHQDISGLVSKDELQAKNYISDISNLVTKDELASKNYLTEHQPLTEVNNRLEVLEAKQDNDTVYNDAELRGRVEALENKPNVDLTNYITSEQLENKHYLTQHQSLDNLVTKEELNSKGYLTQHQNISHLVTNDELNSKGYLTEDVLNTKNYLTQHQDLSEYAKKTELYNDSEVKERLTTLENKPIVDLSGYVTSEQLEAKNYLTSHQPLTHLATNSDLEALRNVSVSKSELSKKVDTTEYNTFKDIVVTKDELNSKGYLTEHQDISNLATKQEVEDTYAKKSTIDAVLKSRPDIRPYNDEPLKERLTALENRPTSQSEMRGTGMPNGVVEAPIGTTYIDTAKTNGALKWIKTTDGGNTGWKVAEGDTGWVLGWQYDTNKDVINKMYFRRKNDVVHVKFNPEIKTSSIDGNTNLILDFSGSYLEDNLSIQGFQPIDDIVQTIFNSTNDIQPNTYSSDNSEGAQGTGAVIIQYEYYKYKDYTEKSGLKLQIVTSELGVKENHVNPFSYLTEDEWPVQLP